ncbi:MAG TPA: anti-sigma factor [Tepidisphaeraceae bacterium]|nr:anti-sigma factor [Tepidisphaeraceae bacterium]
MLGYLTGTLEPAEEVELRQHLASSCPACAGALAEAQATLASLPLALDSVAPSPLAKARLMQRVDQWAASATPERVPYSPPLHFMRIAIPAAIAACIAVMLTHALVTRQLRPQILRGQLAERLVQQQNLQIDSLLTSLKDQKHYVDMLRSPDLKVVQLNGAAQPNALARIMWDQKSGQWLLLTEGLAPMPPNKVYELWFINTDSKKIAAGTFNVDDKGQATMLTKVPANAGSFLVAAITDEPGPVVDPTGTIQLVSRPLGNVQ